MIQTTISHHEIGLQRQWTRNATYQTPNMSNVVQEIVNRGGWSSGNAMVFIISGSGHRTAESYDGSTSKAPLLHIEYAAP